MAKLLGEVLGKPCILEWIVIPPCEQHPRTQHDITLICGEKSFHSLYDVPGPDDDVLSLYWVFRVSYIFQQAKRLLTDTYDFSLARKNTKYSKLANIQLQTSTGWLHVTLDPKTSRDYKKFTHILVQIFAQTDYEEQNNGYTLTNFVRLQLLCLPDDAENFGHALYEECLIAEKAQDQLAELDDED